MISVARNSGCLLLAGVLSSLFSAAPLYAGDQPPQPVHDSATPIRITCGAGYDRKACAQHIAILNKVFSKYSVERLGPWTVVLVSSSDWYRILQIHKLSADIPAITNISARETFFDEALFEPVSTRGMQLSQTWTMAVPNLLDLSVAHEFAHAFCHDFDEEKTIARTKILQHGGTLTCPASSEQPVQTAGFAKHH